ncbi:excalibur calcium-binding domain-containing protein [Pseudonocardia phyllosphaerae]|uniref:excalibur calcium-binding domain-containing protein n=1 Tax=Pseudonocardia phyllosphaerae TaxID=3390502 RepID=UPI00397D2D83
MRLRTLPAAALLAAVAVVPLTGVAHAADRDCRDFSSQAEAQAALRPGDPERLDADDDGIACENTEYGSTGSATTSEPTSEPTAEPGAPSEGTTSRAQVGATPTGGVEAGGGPADMWPIALGAIAAGGVASVATRRIVSRRG